MTKKSNLSIKEFKKFIEANFTYFEKIDEINWRWQDGFQPSMTKKLRNEIIKIIKSKGDNYFK